MDAFGIDENLKASSNAHINHKRGFTDLVVNNVNNYENDTFKLRNITHT